MHMTAPHFTAGKVQPNGITVQETLQNALERLLGTRPAVTGCSRTDAGVHARSFAATSTARKISRKCLKRA
ncbi:MAG: hypothetical protein ACLR56_08495 [Oscillospiraceae bacterium]